MLVKVIPSKVASISSKTVGTSVESIEISGRSCRVLNAGDGIIYINPLEEVTTSNGFQLIGKGDHIDLRVSDKLWVLGDDSNRKVQVLIWED